MYNQITFLLNTTLGGLLLGMAAGSILAGTTSWLTAPQLLIGGTNLWVAYVIYQRITN